jgi:hypothetical protein
MLLLTNGFTLKHGLFTKIILLNKRYVESNLIGFMKEVGGFWKLVGGLWKLVGGFWKLVGGLWK